MIVACCAIISCDEDITPATDCILEGIQLDESNSILFTTISGGLIYEVKQQLTLEDETRTLVSFRFNYFEDSIAIINQSSSVSSQFPHLWINLRENRPVKVVRYFAQSDVQLIHTFDYFDPSKIRIKLDRVASNGSLLKAGYGDYFIDDNGNVIRLTLFGIDPDNSAEFIMTSDRTYSYDEFKNPTKGLYLPYFNATSLPDPRFISNNNILSTNEGSNFVALVHQYGAKSQVTQSREPNGSVLQYSYINCE